MTLPCDTSATRTALGATLFTCGVPGGHATGHQKPHSTSLHQHSTEAPRRVMPAPGSGDIVIPQACTGHHACATHHTALAMLARHLLPTPLLLCCCATPYVITATSRRKQPTDCTCTPGCSPPRQGPQQCKPAPSRHPLTSPPPATLPSIPSLPCPPHPHTPATAPPTSLGTTLWSCSS